MKPAITLLQDICLSYERMSQMAQLLQWDEITAEWNVAEKMLTNLSKIHLMDLAAPERAEASHLIEKILSLQEQIMARITPWQEQVRPLLESFKRYPLKISLDTTKSAG